MPRPLTQATTILISRKQLLVKWLQVGPNAAFWSAAAVLVLALLLIRCLVFAPVSATMCIPLIKEWSMMI